MSDLVGKTSFLVSRLYLHLTSFPAMLGTLSSQLNCSFVFIHKNFVFMTKFMIIYFQDPKTSNVQSVIPVLLHKQFVTTHVAAL